MKLFGNLDLRKSGFFSRITPGTVTNNTTFTLPPSNGTAGTFLTHSFVTGDITVNSSGVSDISAGVIVNADINASAAIAYSKLNLTGSIVNADINASAAIAYSKLAALTANRALVSNGSGFVSVSTVTATELGYVSGVTSSIQDQLNAIAYGTDWKASVRAASTVNIDPTTDLENGDTLDGVTLATGDRVLLKNQTAGEENGIYVVAASGAASRSVDADASAEVTAGLTVYVSEGSAAANTVWQLVTPDPITLNTTPLSFVKIANYGDHGSLSGLGDDDHTQYALLAGRGTGQTLVGGTTSDDYLALSSTSDSTKGLVKIVDGSGFRQEKDPTNLLGVYGDPSDFIIASTESTNNNTPVGLLYSSGGAVASKGSELDVGAARGTFASPTALQNTDSVFRLFGLVQAAGVYADGVAASMRLDAIENHTDSAFGVAWRFLTATVGSVTNAERLNISSAGVKVMNTNLITDTDNTRDIGSSSVGFANAYVNKILLDSNSQTTTIAGSASASASVDYKLPPADGTSGFVLSTNGSGVLSWVSNASSASFSTTISAAATSPQTVTHSLNSTDVMVQIFEVATGETIEVDTVTRTGVNAIDLTFSEAVPTGGWRVMVLKM